MQPTSYETIICVDLRPFDPTSSDQGVGSYLDTLGFVPDRLVFLNFFVDFLHQHSEVENTALNRMTIGQRGMPSVHPWTKKDLRDLVAEVRGRGIQPLLGILSSTRSGIWQGVDIEWSFEEVLQTKRGNQTPFGASINPLKRLRDGTYYEDFLARDLVRVVNAYGFEGYVAGDGMLGLRGPRDTLLDTDFSDDMVDQFSTHADVSFAYIKDYDARADFIVANYYQQWVGFYVQRWGRHVGVMSTALKAQGKSFMAIDSWSRNPEDLVTSFGIDYRLLHAKGLEAVFVQARETNKWRKHREGEYVRESNSLYTFLAHKAYAPDLKFYWAEATVNRPEFWSSVHDLPHVLERETYGYLWTAVVDSGNQLTRTTEGICVIWGNDLTPPQWSWLKKLWDQAYGVLEERVAPIGATLIWNEAFVREAAKEQQGVGQLFADLIDDGVCCQAVVNEATLGGRQDQGVYITFDSGILRRRPDLKSNLFTVGKDRIEWDEHRYSWQEGVEKIKSATRLRSSRGRLMGFEGLGNRLILSAENPDNLFYEHVTLEVPGDITEVEVLPPREWFEIPHSRTGNRVTVSVAPDASTQLRIKLSGAPTRNS